jgi:hypothetical protein
MPRRTQHKHSKSKRGGFTVKVRGKEYRLNLNPFTRRNKYARFSNTSRSRSRARTPQIIGPPVSTHINDMPFTGRFPPSYPSYPSYPKASPRYVNAEAARYPRYVNVEAAKYPRYVNAPAARSPMYVNAPNTSGEYVNQ